MNNGAVCCEWMVYLQDKNFFILLTVEALAPPQWWTQCTCTCSALTQLPLGSPDLHAHSFPNWALNPGKERRKKRERRKQNLIFMVNWEVTVGPISQVHLNKSIKAYPNTKGEKKKAPTPSPTVLFCRLHLAVKTVARRLCKCLSKADWA